MSYTAKSSNQKPGSLSAQSQAWLPPRQMYFRSAPFVKRPEIVLPSLNGFGYLTTEESNYKYPVFADSTNDYFIIKEDGLVYLMK